QPGNKLGGRHRGAKDKISAAYLNDLLKSYLEPRIGSPGYVEPEDDSAGLAAIRKVRDNHPDKYLQQLAAVLPKDIDITTNHFEGISYDELNVIIERIRVEISAKAAGGGEGADGERGQTQLLQALPQTEGLPRSGRKGS